MPDQHGPLSLPSVPTYDDGVKSPSVAMACAGMSEEENSTPAVAVAVLTQREIVWELKLPRPRSGSWTYEDVPLKPAAVEVLPAGGPAWLRGMLLYVALSTGRTSLPHRAGEDGDGKTEREVWRFDGEAGSPTP
ncbi:hypothetical protein [Streptomyces kaempferi]|uniref:Uncharacterized protein n=1 Tax=Streptomyces kaempferi TaxID=333725 RepID=A0ABW3XP73_9ACTN